MADFHSMPLFHILNTNLVCLPIQPWLRYFKEKDMVRAMTLLPLTVGGSTAQWKTSPVILSSTGLSVK